MDFETIAEEQGWDDSTRIMLLTTFIEENDLIDELSEFAEDYAEDDD